MPKKQGTEKKSKIVKSSANKVKVNDIGGFAEYFRALDNKYGDMDAESKLRAVLAAGKMFDSYNPDPNVQNRRVKGISSLPVDMKKNDISGFLKNPNGSERPLRQLSNILEYTAYPYFKLRKTYQDILTYRYYSYPCYLEESDAEKKVFRSLLLP